MTDKAGKRTPGGAPGVARTGPLSAAQRLAMQARADGMSYARAAAHAGIDEASVRRLANSTRGKDYIAKLVKDRDEEDLMALRAARRAVGRLVPKALSGLARILDDREAPASAQVGAARTILEHGLPDRVEISGPDGAPVAVDHAALHAAARAMSPSQLGVQAPDVGAWTASTDAQ